MLREMLVRTRLVLFFFAVSLMPLSSAWAQVVEDVQVETLADGYEVSINFAFQLRYKSHSPGEPGRDLRVQMRLLNENALTTDELDLLRERFTLGWERKTGIPLQEITFEGGDPEQPEMTFLFTKDVDFEVRSSGDLRSLIVKVITPPMPDVSQKVEEKEKEMASPVAAIAEPVDIVPQDANLASLMAEAKAAMTKKDYNRAVQLYTKILRVAEGDVKKQAQEFLGLARERKGQKAHARAEYENYLKDYPTGPDADRVRQRLAGLVTSTKKPKAPLKAKSTTGGKKMAAAEKEPKWTSRYYGSLSQFFFRDQTTPEGGETQVNRSDVTSDVDANGRWRNDKYDIHAKFTGGHRKTFLTDDTDDERISHFSAEIEDKDLGLSGKIGRQTLTSGGVLGRFDGFYTSYDLSDHIKINGVAGFPVQSTRQISIDTARRFVGVSADFGTYDDKWDYKAFAINQTNEGLTDRQAVGGEVRYFDPVKSFFTLLDYDVFFNSLNIFLMNGHWNVREKTVLNFILDYRRSPLLTINNAIQGQSVESIADIKGTFSDSELKKLADDRSAVSKSATIGVTHDISDDIQVNAELTTSELDSTPASGGVAAVPGTGQEYFYSAQLITNDVIMDNDVIIPGVRYSDTQNNNTYTFTLNSRFPVTKDFRVIPKFRADYRTEKDSNDDRVTIRPVLRADYRLKKWLRFEAEIGMEWRDESTNGVSQKSTESFISVGYRMNF